MDLSIDDKLKYYWMSHDIHNLMIHENYINNTLTSRDELKRLENISYSADSLSDVDFIDSQFNFELMPYVAMNTIKATSKCNKKGQIKFTQMLGKISTINKNKREKIDYNKVKLFEDKTVTKKINKNKKK
jgi:hypothetical protein